MLKKVIDFRRKYGGNLIQSSFTLLDNLLVFILNRNVKRAPAYVGWDVTFRCNSRCSYCLSWKLGLENKEKELTTQESLDVIRQLGKLKTWMLSFTGGEPLLRKDIFLLIKEAKKRRIGTNLNTNGFFLEEKAEEIIDSGLDTLTVSVESHDPEVHDSIRNCKNSFNRLEKGIKKLNKLRKEKKTHKPFIMIRANVSKANYKELEKYFEYWKDKVDDIKLQPIHEGTANNFLHVQKDGILFQGDEEKEYLKYMRRLYKKYPSINTGYHNEFYNFFFNKKEMEKKYRCFALYTILTLDPYGNVYPCTEFISKLGNLRKESLIRILNNKKSRNFRKMLKKKQNKCFCWYNCTGPINHALGKFLK